MTPQGPRFRLEEGMSVVGEHGEKIGEIGQIVVGRDSREPRFFTVQKGWIFHSDYMVPREAVTHVDDDGLHLGISDAQVKNMPEWTGEAPTEEDVHRAYENLGGTRADTGAFHFDALPFEREVAEHGLRDQAEASQGTIPREREHAYTITIEEYLVLTPEQRQERGFGREWSPSGTGSPGR